MSVSTETILIRFMKRSFLESVKKVPILASSGYRGDNRS